MTESKPAYEPSALLSPAASPLDTWQKQPAPTRTELAAAWISYPVAYLYVAGLWFGFALLPWNTAADWLLFSAAFFLWGEWAARARERRTGRRLSAAARRESWFWLACAAGIVLGGCLHGDLIWSSWESLALHGIAAYWVLCRMGLLAEGGTGALFPLDSLNALVVEPFRSFFSRISTLIRALGDVLAHRRAAQPQGRRVRWKSLGLSLLWVAAALPFVVLAACLLIRADDGFARLMQSLILWQGWSLPQALRQAWDEIWLRGLAALPVGAYLHGLVGGCLRREKPWIDAPALRRETERVRFVPRGGAAVVFAALLGLYLLFFAVQGGYLFGAFTGRPPEGFTVAQYARQGFFQLCQVAALNFGLLAAAAKCSRRPLRQDRLLRTLALLLMAANLLLAVTAFSKLGLYIMTFGFTQKRLLSSWAVLSLAAGSVLAGASILRPFRAVRVWLWFSAAAFSVMCLL